MKARTFLIFAIVVGSCGGAYWLGVTGGGRDRAAGPTFQVVDGPGVEATALDLGAVWVGQDFAPSFTIHNRRAGPIEIGEFRTSCGCTAVEPPSLTIPAGGTASVRLRLNLAPRWQPEVAVAARPFFVDVRPVAKLDEHSGPQEQGDCEGCSFQAPAAKETKPSPPRSWRFGVLVKNPVTLDRLCLHFGDSPVRGGPAVARKVRAGLQVPEAALRARAVPDLVTVRITPEPGDLGRCELVIAPLPTLPVGAFACKVHLDALLPSGERLPGPALSVWGNVQPAVRALPAQLVLGRGTIGESAESTVTLQGPKGQEWAVDHVELESADVTVQPADVPGLPPGRTFRVRQRITKEGPQASAVRFFVRQAGGPPESVAVQVRYEGINPRPADAGGERGKKP
jgi:hypothetical protein